MFLRPWDHRFAGLKWCQCVKGQFLTMWKKYRWGQRRDVSKGLYTLETFWSPFHSRQKRSSPFLPRAQHKNFLILHHTQHLITPTGQGTPLSTPLCPLSVPSSSTPLPTSQLEGHHYDSKAETGFTCSPLSVLLPRPMGRLHFPDFLVITSRPGDVDCGQKLYIRFSVLAIKLPNNCPYSLFPFHSNHAGHGLKMAAWQDGRSLDALVITWGRAPRRASQPTLDSDMREKYTFFQVKSFRVEGWSSPQHSIAYPDQYKPSHLSITLVTNKNSQRTLDIGWLNQVGLQEHMKFYHKARLY